MPSRLAHRVAARFVFASALDQAARDVAKGLTKLIQQAEIPVEARRFTELFRELSIQGSKGWIRPKRFYDVIFQPRSAQNYIGISSDDDGEAQFERQQYVEEAANAILLKSGIIGRHAR